MSAHMPSWRRTAGPGLLLVLLALVSQLVLPPGVMPAAGPGLPLVLCTGHGPAGFAPTAPADQRHDGGAQHACPFAHHGLTSPVSAAPTLALAEARYDVADPPRPVGASPGAGLAAPPPPSHAPPLRLHA